MKISSELAACDLYCSRCHSLGIPTPTILDGTELVQFGPEIGIPYFMCLDCFEELRKELDLGDTKLNREWWRNPLSFAQKSYQKLPGDNLWGKLWIGVLGGAGGWFVFHEWRMCGLLALCYLGLLAVIWVGILIQEWMKKQRW